MGWDERAIGPLIKTLEDRDPDMRRTAAYALSSILDARVLAPLTRALRDPDPEVRRWALLGLGRFGDQAPVAAIVKALREPGRLERKAAQEALIAIGSAAIPALTKVVDSYTLSEDLSVTTAAIKILGRIGNSETISRLIGFLSSFHLPVRKEAAQALAHCAARRPSLEVRAALPSLHRLVWHDEVVFYRRIIREIEAATSSLAGLPIPAEPPASLVSEMPIPAEPGAFGPTPGASADPSPRGKGEDEDGLSISGSPELGRGGLSSPTPPSLTGKGAGGLGSFLRGWRPFR